MSVNLDTMIANALSAAKHGRKGPFSHDETKEAMRLFIDQLTGPAMEESLLGQAKEVDERLRKALVLASREQDQADARRREAAKTISDAEGAIARLNTVADLPEDAANVVRLTSAVASALARAVGQTDAYDTRLAGRVRDHQVSDVVAKSIVTSTSYIVWAFVTGRTRLPVEEES